MAEISSIVYQLSAIQSFQCSSASRKFLNPVTNHLPLTTANVSVLFSEPKIPQLDYRRTSTARTCSFSALQRAENSSIHPPYNHRTSHEPFQCSSASRKFLNATVPRRFLCYPSDVSVLFSEPKIPQSERH